MMKMRALIMKMTRTSKRRVVGCQGVCLGRSNLWRRMVNWVIVNQDLPDVVVDNIAKVEQAEQAEVEQVEAARGVGSSGRRDKKKTRKYNMTTTMLHLTMTTTKTQSKQTNVLYLTKS